MKTLLSTALLLLLSAADKNLPDDLPINKIQVIGSHNSYKKAIDPALFKKLYVDFDPSRPTLRATAAEMEKDMAPWRALMNEVVANSRAAQKAAKKGKK